MINIIQYIEKKYSKKKLTNFFPGNVIQVEIWINEKNKKRIQKFYGTVISIKKKGLNSSFTIRKKISNEGIERTFLIHSPTIYKITILKYERSKKSKLFYLRKKKEKSIKIQKNT